MDDSRIHSPNEVDTTSTRLLRAAAKQDGQAWRQVVTIYGPVVRYWIRGKGLSGSDLADVFQEVFLAASRTLARFEREDGKAKFRAWLKTITLSKVNDHFRRQGKQPVGVGGSTAMMRIGELEALEKEAGQEDEGDEVLAYSEDTFVVQRALQTVKHEFREKTWLAFHRTAIDGRTSQEVAKELSMTALAVRKAKSRVIQRLKEALNAYDGGAKSDK